MLSSSDELAKKKARLAELRKAKEARLASASSGSAQVRCYNAVVQPDKLELTSKFAGATAVCRRAIGINTCNFVSV
jgi:hypothetical protein